MRPAQLHSCTAGERLRPARSLPAISTGEQAADLKVVGCFEPEHMALLHITGMGASAALVHAATVLQQAAQPQPNS